MLVFVLVWGAAAALAASWLLARRVRMGRVSRAVPELPGGLPLLGHALRGVGDTKHVWNFLTEISRDTMKAGGVGKSWLGPALYITVSDFKIAQTLANTYLDKDFMYSFASPWIGEGLLTAKAAAWHRDRKLLCPAFNQRVLDGFLGVFNSQAAALVEALGLQVGRGSFNALPALSANALETICRTAIGIPIEERTAIDRQYTCAVERMLAIIGERTMKVWMHLDLLYQWTTARREEAACVKVLKKMSATVIQKRKALKGKAEDTTKKPQSGHKFKAFLDLLLELEEVGLLSQRQVREQVDTMVVAGHDTTATTLLYLLLLLGSAPAPQRRLQREVDEIFGDSDREVTKEDLSRLEYMDAVIKEGLRLYPVAPMVARYADKDLHLENFSIPAGSGILISLWAILRGAGWQDPEEFRPERWLNPGPLPESASNFAAFSIGRRGCIGKTYAMMSMKVTLCHVFRRYNISSRIQDLTLKFDFILKPASGHHIEITSR